MPPWRNRLARSAVNRKVGGSSPPGGEPLLIVYLSIIFVTFHSQQLWHAPLLVYSIISTVLKKKFISDPSRIRTCNLLIRSQTRYPLRHRTSCYECFSRGYLITCVSKNGGIPTRSFHSVVVITCPSHGQGRRFDPGWKHLLLLFLDISNQPQMFVGHHTITFQNNYSSRKHQRRTQCKGC
jgi:hypothetical protein